MNLVGRIQSQEYFVVAPILYLRDCYASIRAYSAYMKAHSCCSGVRVLFAVWTSPICALYDAAPSYKAFDPKLRMRSS